jgi:formate/nitrite transporter FocA (FNT family)
MNLYNSNDTDIMEYTSLCDSPLKEGKLIESQPESKLWLVSANFAGLIFGLSGFLIGIGTQQLDYFTTKLISSVGFLIGTIVIVVAKLLFIKN